MPTAGGYLGIPIYGIMNKTRINYKRDKIYMQTETLKPQLTGNIKILDATYRKYKNH